MRFLLTSLIGFRAYLEALRFIFSKGLYWYLLIPAVLMVGIYQLGFTVQQHLPKAHVTNMNEIVWYMVRILTEISLGILFLKFTKYLMVMLLSPVLAIISEKVETKLTGNTYTFTWSQLYEDVRRGIRIAFRNIFWEYVFSIFLYLIAVICFDKPDSSFPMKILFFVGCFYYGFSYLDYTLERMRLSVNDSVVFMHENMGLAIVIGAIYGGLLLLPLDLKYLFDWSDYTASPTIFLQRFVVHSIYGLLIAFAPIWSIVAATIALHNLVDLTHPPKTEEEESKEELKEATAHPVS